jgi:hypothetical protein
MKRCAATIWTRNVTAPAAYRRCSRNAVFGDWCRQHSDGSYPRWDAADAKLAELERSGRSVEEAEAAIRARREEEENDRARLRIFQRLERRRFRCLS